MADIVGEYEWKRSLLTRRGFILVLAEQRADRSIRDEGWERDLVNVVESIENWEGIGGFK